MHWCSSTSTCPGASLGSLRGQVPQPGACCSALSRRSAGRAQLACSSSHSACSSASSSSSRPQPTLTSSRTRTIICSASPQAQQAYVSSGAPQSQTQAAAGVPTATASASTAAAAAAAAQRALPFAALSRVLLTGNNSAMFRSALNQRRPVSGPMGLLLLVATIIAASFAAIRSALVRRGKSCKTCRGFGLQRCRLCLGSGRVDWAAKLNHFDVCPLCMNKRFIVCGECGGHYHRSMFSHRRRQTGGTLEPVSSDEPLIVLAAAGAGAGGGNAILSSMND